MDTCEDDPPKCVLICLVSKIFVRNLDFIFLWFNTYLKGRVYIDVSMKMNTKECIRPSHRNVHKWKNKTVQTFAIIDSPSIHQDLPWLWYFFLWWQLCQWLWVEPFCFLINSLETSLSKQDHRQRVPKCFEICGEKWKNAEYVDNIIGSNIFLNNLEGAIKTI